LLQDTLQRAQRQRFARVIGHYDDAGPAFVAKHGVPTVPIDVPAGASQRPQSWAPVTRGSRSLIAVVVL
jgi:hypothetical protein